MAPKIGRDNLMNRDPPIVRVQLGPFVANGDPLISVTSIAISNLEKGTPATVKVSHLATTPVLLNNKFPNGFPFV